MTDTGIMIDAKVYPIVEPQNNVLAFSTVTIGDMITIRGVRVVDSEKGRFVAMPQTKGAEGKYWDVAHPTTKELRQELNAAVLKAYEEAEKKTPISDVMQDAKAASSEKEAATGDKPAKSKAQER